MSVTEFMFRNVKLEDFPVNRQLVLPLQHLKANRYFASTSVYEQVMFTQNPERPPETFKIKMNINNCKNLYIFSVITQ